MYEALQLGTPGPVGSGNRGGVVSLLSHKELFQIVTGLLRVSGPPGLSSPHPLRGLLCRDVPGSSPSVGSQKIAKRGALLPKWRHRLVSSTEQGGSSCLVRLVP